MLSSHIAHLNLTHLNVVGLTEKLMTTFSENTEKADMLESLIFGCLLYSKLDLLNDLVFFQNLKQLSICYLQEDKYLKEETDTFNNTIIEPILMDVCIKLEALTIGGLLDNTGAEHISKSIQKYGKITHLRILNCTNINEDALYEILKHGYEIRAIDIRGTLGCATGQAFFREAGNVLHSLKTIRMNVVFNQKLYIQENLKKLNIIVIPEF